MDQPVMYQPPSTPSSNRWKINRYTLLWLYDQYTEHGMFGEPSLQAMRISSFAIFDHKLIKLAENRNNIDHPIAKYADLTVTAKGMTCTIELEVNIIVPDYMMMSVQDNGNILDTKITLVKFKS